jgi:hypothetical protein
MGGERGNDLPIARRLLAELHLSVLGLPELESGDHQETHTPGFGTDAGVVRLHLNFTS